MAKYNGWTNYETWAVKLWMDNEQGTHEYWMDAAREVWESAEATGSWTKPQAAKYNLADKLKDEHDKAIPEYLSGSVYADLLNAALSEVNWHEIAQSLLEDRE